MVVEDSNWGLVQYGGVRGAGNEVLACELESKPVKKVSQKSILGSHPN